jgi:chromosome segregation ATPase
MADSETPIATIRERLTGVLADWAAELSAVLSELEEKRSRLEEIEATESARSREVETLEKRLEAQDALIESLNVDVGEAASLRKELHDRELELETRNSEIESKQVLIGALRRDAEGIGKLKGDGRVKDQEIARLMQEKQDAEQRAAEVSEEFEILTASTLTGRDAVKELEAVRAELDARKCLIDSLRSDAARAKDLEAQLEQKRNVISQLEASIDQHVSSIAELQEAVSEWKTRFAEVKSGTTEGDSATIPSLGELSDEDLQALGLGDTGEKPLDATISVDMRDTILRSQQAPGGKITTNR